MTSQSQCLCDSSSYANFYSWASAISGALASFTWAQSSDSGQVMWSGMSLSAVTVSGSNATYTYSGLTGLALAVGRALTITGMTHSQNNGVFVITGLGTGTFTVVNASAVAESGSTGVVTQASSVPGSAAFVYEVWTPNDSLTNFFLKVEYGNVSGTNCPSLRITISGTGTNGAGTLSGALIGPQNTNSQSFTPPSTSIQYECDFSGAAGRFGAMLWRNGTNSCQQLFAIQRSINSSGAYTSSYVTLWTAGDCSGAGYDFSQRSLVFGVGVAPALPSGTNNTGGWTAVAPVNTNNTANTVAFNNSIPLDLARPLVGFLDYACTVVGTAAAGDYTEGVTFVNAQNSHTYMPSKNGPFSYSPTGNSGSQNAITVMQYD